MSDTETICQVLSGRTEQFADLVERYLPVARGVCMSHVFTPGVHEDLIQEAFLYAYQRLDKLRNRERFGPWLARIVRSQCVEWLRTERRRGKAQECLGKLSPPDQDGRDLVLRRELWEWMCASVAQLPEKTREAMVLHYFEGISLSEIARLSRTREWAIKKRLQYGRKLLGERLFTEFAQNQPRGQTDEESKALKQRILAAVPLVPVPWKGTMGRITPTSPFTFAKLLVSVAVAVLIGVAVFRAVRATSRPTQSVAQSVPVSRETAVPPGPAAPQAALSAAVQAVDAPIPASSLSPSANPAPQSASSEENGKSVITGVVIRADGTPVPRVTIQRALPDGSEATSIGYTDDGGRYRIKQDGGLYRIRAASVSSVDLVEDEGLACSDWAELVLDRGESAEQDFIFPDTTDLILHVAIPDGTPVTGSFCGMMVPYPAFGKAQHLGYCSEVLGGKITLSYLLPGRYDLKARIDGYDPVIVEDFNIRASGANEMKITTKLSALSLTVQVLRPDGKPWPGLSVGAHEYYALRAANGEPVPNCNLSSLHKDAKTDVNGECVLGSLWKGIFRVAAYSPETPRYGIGEMIELPREKPLVLRASIERHDMRYEVRLVAADGQVLDHREYPVMLYVVTADGLILAGPACNGTRLPEGRNLLVVVKEGYTAGIEWLDVKPLGQPEDAHTANVNLQEAGGLSGTVEDASGPRANVSLLAYPAAAWGLGEDNPEEWHQLGLALAQGAITDSDGRFTLTLLPPGEYIIATDAETYSEPVEVSANVETGGVTIRERN